MGILGVAFTGSDAIPDPKLNSIPPTLGGGNIDIKHLGAGSTFYLPVFVPGALFYIGDPHHGWATEKSRSRRWKARCAARSA